MGELYLAEAQVRTFVTDFIERINAQNPEIRARLRDKVGEKNPHYVNYKTRNAPPRVDITIECGGLTKYERGAAFDAAKNAYGDAIAYISHRRWCSVGHLEFTGLGSLIRIQFKAGVKHASARIKVKESLVSLVYASQYSTDVPVTRESFETVRTDLLTSLCNLPGTQIPGETAAMTAQVKTYLENAQNAPAARNQLGDAISQAGHLLRAYPGWTLLHHGPYDRIRTRAKEITSLKRDKWNPSDLYLFDPSTDPLEIADRVDKMETVEEINALFESTWGAQDAPIVGVSLKDGDARGGKGFTFLSRITDERGEIYRVTEDEERALTPAMTRKAVDAFRVEIRDLIDTLNARKTPHTYHYQITGTPDEDRIISKYRCLKVLRFMLERERDRITENSILFDASRHALSLTNNPPFFIIQGDSGVVRSADVELSSNHILILDQGRYAGIRTLFEGQFGEKNCNVPLVIRTNGNFYPTLEIDHLYKRTEKSGGKWMHVNLDEVGEGAPVPHSDLN